METWKEIPGFEGYYQASNLGRIRSVERKVKNASGSYNLRKSKILKQHPNPQGYLRVALYIENKSTWHRVHRLIASAFIPNTLNKPHINHINGIKDDNKPENLEWVAVRENMFGFGYEDRTNAGKKQTKAMNILTNEIKIFNSRRDLQTYFKCSGNDIKFDIPYKRGTKKNWVFTNI